MTTTQERTGAGTDFAAARRAMIDSQLRTSGVNQDWVLDAMRKAAREDFVPADRRSTAYMDRATPLGGGKFLAAPVVQGMMLAEARPVASDRALLVDGGSGYMATLLAMFVGTLDTVDAAAGADGDAPGEDYTLIVVDGAIERLPEALSARLASNGRLVTGLVERSVTRLATGRKAGSNVALLRLGEIGIPVLPEFAKPVAWRF